MFLNCWPLSWTIYIYIFGLFHLLHFWQFWTITAWKCGILFSDFLHCDWSSLFLGWIFQLFYKRILYTLAASAWMCRITNIIWRFWTFQQLRLNILKVAKCSLWVLAMILVSLMKGITTSLYWLWVQIWPPALIKFSRFLTFSIVFFWKFQQIF